MGQFSVESTSLTSLLEKVPLERYIQVIKSATNQLAKCAGSDLSVAIKLVKTVSNGIGSAGQEAKPTFRRSKAIQDSTRK